MNVTNKIKEARIKKRLTQKELAQKLCITLRHYQRIEAGEVEPSVYTGLVLCYIIDSDPYYIFDVELPN